MGGGDPLNDGQPQPGAVAAAPAAPEALEQALTVGSRHSRAAIGHLQRRLCADRDLDRGVGRRVLQCVLDQVAHRLAQRLGIAPDQRDPRLAAHRHRPRPPQRERRQRRRHVDRDRMQVGGLVDRHVERLELRHRQQLADQASHALDVFA